MRLVAYLQLWVLYSLGSRCSRTASRERTRRPDCQYAASTSAVCELRELTFPTAASPSRTSLTLLLGLGADAAPESAMVANEDEIVGVYQRWCVELQTSWETCGRGVELPRAPDGKDSASSDCSELLVLE